MIELAAVCGFVFLVGVFLRFIDKRMASSIIKGTVNDVKLINDPVTIMNPSDFQQDKSYAYLLGKILKPKPKPKPRARVKALLVDDQYGLSKQKYYLLHMYFGIPRMWSQPKLEGVEEYMARVNDYTNFMNSTMLYNQRIKND